MPEHVEVRRTEHVEVTSRAVEAVSVKESAASGPRTVRVFRNDYQTTDSSGDDDNAEAAAAAARRRVKRYVQEIRLERAVKEAPPARAAASSAAAATALARVKLVLPGWKKKADGGTEPRFRGVRRRPMRRRPRTRPLRHIQRLRRGVPQGGGVADLRALLFPAVRGRRRHL